MLRTAFAAISCLTLGISLAQPIGADVTTPKAFLGHSIGDDYWLANYKQLADYWNKVDAESERLRVVSIGKTEEGRDQLMSIISSPENLRRLNHYRNIARKLALGEATTTEAEALAKEGKAIVWIDGGLHATEVLGAQQLIETVYRLASRTDEETVRILNDCIILVVHANPDGMDLVSDWYMRRPSPQERSLSGLPRLYQKYVGHDNNRDFYANTQAETINMNHILYREWFPQIMYNHHQTAPSGTIIFAPPFRGPYNYHVDPLVEVTTAMVGMAMHTRFVGESKPGAVMRTAASYQTWWNGGLRTTAYFHNMVGILTEAFGSPNPSQIRFNPDQLVPSTEIPFPVQPQEWKFAQSIEYELTANYAILDYASRYRTQLLRNTYTMARNAIENGRKDTWTMYPKRVAGAESIAAIRTPANRDAKAYLVPSDQQDFATATRFINALIHAGITVHQMKSPTNISGKIYPAGSFVVRSDQAFRAHVLDMFEPQDYPNDFQYQGGPPIAPYDNAGYTLAYSMGVQFDRLLEPYEAQLTVVDGLAKMPSMQFPVDTGAGYLVDHHVNNAFAAINEVLRSGGTVKRSADGFYVPFAARSSEVLAKAAFEMGVPVTAAGAAPANSVDVKKARIALWDRYGGSMASGWTRWLLEQFKFDFVVVYPPDIDSGKLANYDVLILPTDATFSARTQTPLTDTSIPQEWRNRMGSLSVERSVPKIKEFLESGKTVIAVGGAGSLARHMQLPVTNHLVETVNEQERALPREKLFVPTSILRMEVNTANSAAGGMPKQVDVVFDNSPVYRLLPGATERGITPILSFSGDSPLRSGWAWGQQYLNGGVGGFEAFVGRGRLLVYGPEISFRAQPHGTFKLLFNALYVLNNKQPSHH